MDVRPFERRDREQLRDLASAHVGAAIPGATLPAATLLDQLKRPLGEYVVGPWVTDLATLVVAERDRIVAAAHLRRYSKDGHVGEDYRNAGEIVWLLCWPDHLQAGRAVRDAGLVQLRRWEVSRWLGDGSLPAPGSTACPTRGHTFKGCIKRPVLTQAVVKWKSSTPVL